MKRDIRTRQTAIWVALGLVASTIVGLAATQLPQLRRYIKIRNM